MIYNKSISVCWRKVLCSYIIHGDSFLLSNTKSTRTDVRVGDLSHHGSINEWTESLQYHFWNTDDSYQLSMALYEFFSQKNPEKSYNFMKSWYYFPICEIRFHPRDHWLGSPISRKYRSGSFSILRKLISVRRTTQLLPFTTKTFHKNVHFSPNLFINMPIYHQDYL